MQTRAKPKTNASRAALEQCQRLHELSQLISSDLNLERVVQTVTDVAREACGAQFAAFFYNVTDEQGESYRLYTLSGAPREAFEHFGLPRNTQLFEATFRGTHVVRADDIRTHPLFGKNAPHYGMPKGHLPVVSYLAVPVISRAGHVLGGLFFAHCEAAVFDDGCEAFVKGIAAHAAIAIDNAQLHRKAECEIERRRRAEERLELLLGEVKHRYKNAVVTIQSIAAQTYRCAGKEAHEQFNARLAALAKALDLLTTKDWDRAAVSDVIARTLAPFDSDGRLSYGGPDLQVSADNSLALALAIHELATNAVKYGALSNADGRVHISWESIDAERSRVRVHWQEVGGPRVTPPAKAGFGTVLIQRALGGAYGESRMEFNPDGPQCTFETPL